MSVESQNARPHRLSITAPGNNHQRRFALVLMECVLPPVGGTGDQVTLLDSVVHEEGSGGEYDGI